MTLNDSYVNNIAITSARNKKHMMWMELNKDRLIKKNTDQPPSEFMYTFVSLIHQLT